MDGVGGEAAVRQVQHPHAGSPDEEGTVQEFRCSICLLHGTAPIFLVFFITRKIIFPSTFDIYFEAPLSAVPGEEVGEGVVDREGLTVALQPHHAAARVAASRGQGEVEDSNGECFYSLLQVMA